MSIKPDLSLVIAVLLALVLFGTGYNQLISWMERTRIIEGYTALMVAVGVAVTLAAIAIICGWQVGLIALAAFAASGAPMLIGSLWRYARARHAEQKALRELAK